MTAMRHGEQTAVDLAAFLGDDPELGLVNADMAAWEEAHPCICTDDEDGLHRPDCPQA